MLGNRLTVDQRTLTPLVLVRIQVPQPHFIFSIKSTSYGNFNFLMWAILGDQIRGILGEFALWKLPCRRLVTASPPHAPCHRATSYTTSRDVILKFLRVKFDAHLIPIHSTHLGGRVSMLVDPSNLVAVWQQSRIPVAWRSGEKGKPLLVKLPYRIDNRAWLASIGRNRPVWMAEGKNWEVPKSWFNAVVDKSLERFGKIYVIQPYREQEKCAPACMNARGHICQCSCMGANHGTGNDGSWFEISETFATRWGGRELACRLMTRR